jgi:LexA DNA binding domain
MNNSTHEDKDTKENIRPTKMQRQLLSFIDAFIKEHGYSPSYREIMRGCGYNSVATVALHIRSLITRGHLVKRDYSARSLEVVGHEDILQAPTKVRAGEEKWLIDKVHFAFQEVEEGSGDQGRKVDELYVLVGALKVLGFEEAALSFIGRLNSIK